MQPRPKKPTSWLTLILVSAACAVLIAFVLVLRLPPGDPTGRIAASAALTSAQPPPPPLPPPPSPPNRPPIDDPNARSQIPAVLGVAQRLPEEKRRKIWLDLFRAGDQVSREVKAKYPRTTQGDMEQGAYMAYLQEKHEYYESRREKHWAPVLNKHGITRQEAAQITEEGALNNWPVPIAPRERVRRQKP